MLKKKKSQAPCLTPDLLLHHRIGFKLLKLANELSPALLPELIARSVIQVAAVYVGLFLTSGLIDSLVALEVRACVAYAAALVGVAFSASVVDAVLERRTGTKRRRAAQLVRERIREKAMSLDFETAESAAFRERIYGLEENVRYMGGLGYLVDNYAELLRQVLLMASCVVLVVALCVAPGTAGGVLGALSSPVASACILAAAFALLNLGAGWLARARAKQFSAFAQDQTQTETMLAYFRNSFVFGRGFDKAVRLYDMDGLLEGKDRDATEKTTPFFRGYKMGQVVNDAQRTAVNGVFVAASYAFVVVKVLAGAITVGSFATYAGALAQFCGAYSKAREVSSHIREQCGYLGEFLEILEIPSAHATGSIPVEKRDDGEFDLAFEHVSFRYLGTDRLVLDDVCCSFSTKRKMAVVGPNGAGKTTFIKLLCRLYEPTGGRITLNGVDIRKYDEEEYRGLFGVVFQDFKLFAAPVWENVCAGAERDDEKLSRVLDESGAAGFVDGLPGGADTLLYRDLGDGVEPSGGEAQKLALARALYRDAPVVILDEPTAALDPLAEAEVYEGFDAMVAGKTAIYISHRMSSCRFCDEILVFDGGRIVERGDHEGLLAAGGLYADLWNSQAQYYA